MSLRIGFDIDGVVADFQTRFSEVAAELLPHRRDAGAARADISDADTQRVWKVIADTPNWWLTLAPYEPHEIARLYRLSREFKWEIFFMTARVPTAGDSVLFQSQWWLETHGFYLPSVATVMGSRGDLANSLRLDLLVDDLFMNCVDVIAASKTKTLLMLRSSQQALHDRAIDSGIGVVGSLTETIEVMHRLHRLAPDRRRNLTKLSEWFFGRTEEPALTLPLNPRATRPLEGSEGPQK